MASFNLPSTTAGEAGMPSGAYGGQNGYRNHDQPLANGKTCNRKGTCRYCPRLNHSGMIKNLQNGRRYCTVGHTNCQTSNLIYCISCNLCPTHYVGKTKNSIVKRFSTHLYDIEHGLDTTVAKHFNDHGVSTDKYKFQIYVLELINRNPETREGAKTLAEQEKKWIKRLDTYFPKGLNIQH